MAWNKLQNFEFYIDQDLNSSGTTTSGTYPVDGWILVHSNDVTTQTASRITGEERPYALRYEVTTGSDATLAAGQLGIYQTKIEGYDIIESGFGASGASTVYTDCRMKASVGGTYCVALRNGANDRSYVHEVSLSSGVWTDVSISIAGDTTGTWPVDNSAAMVLSFCVGTGTTFQTTAGSWAAGNYIGTSNQTNMLATNGATLDIEAPRLGIGAQITEVEWLPIAIHEKRAYRYFERFRANIGGNHAAGGRTYECSASYTEKRTTPTLATITSPTNTNISGAGVLTPGLNGCRAYATGSASGTFSSLDGLYSADARL